MSLRSRVSDDLVLVLCGIVVGVIYLWSGLNGVKCMWDWYLLLGPALVMILVPMFWSSWVYHRNRTNK